MTIVLADLRQKSPEQGEKESDVDPSNNPSAEKIIESSISGATRAEALGERGQGDAVPTTEDLESVDEIRRNGAFESVGVTREQDSFLVAGVGEEGRGSIGRSMIKKVKCEGPISAVVEEGITRASESRPPEATVETRGVVVDVGGGSALAGKCARDHSGV